MLFCGHITLTWESGTLHEKKKTSKVLYKLNKGIYSWFSRHCTARGSSTGLCQVGPAKVKAYKSILLNEGSPEVEIKNACLILLLQ